jgi:acyl-[acyl-carrier-protein]-phospholipid O-acyltransferase/long-chain-fatty-acid--[acyl-carrier-protein] ligase
MLIRGPNVMKGYLNQPAKTAEALRDGWYVTGDIATVDEDGFITITDRLSRFSKIAGEMVPHLAIEEEYLKGLNKAEPVLAVASVPDEKKGEKLVVLYTDGAGDPAAAARHHGGGQHSQLVEAGPDQLSPHRGAAPDRQRETGCEVPAPARG